MSQTPNERLKEYLGQLTPQSQALLMQEFERAIARGEDQAVASIVLEMLRKVMRMPSATASASGNLRAPVRADGSRQHGGEAARLFFRPLEPFLIEGSLPPRPGQVRRASLMPVWQWLSREGAPEPLREFETAYSDSRETGVSRDIEISVRKLQMAAADAIFKLTSPAGGDKQRALARVGPPEVVEDLLPIGAVLHAREALDGFVARIPGVMRVFGDSQITSVCEALNIPTLQTPQVLPFALSLAIQRLTAPWQIIRLAIKIAASDDEVRVAATSYSVAVTIALHDLFCLASTLRFDIRRSQFANVPENLKALHDGVRGLRTELDLRQESTWGKQLASIRADISDTVQSEIESVPGRVRRILRQRPDKEIPIGSGIDGSEVDEVAALIAFVAVCRTYASELAINEVTLRSYSELQQYVEKATEALVESLRGGDIKARAYRQMQAQAAVRFCEVLFGQEYASLMSRAIDNALPTERKSSRAN
ncbi:MAG: hypothetical protein JOY90_05300 [Bradyrhizobium sp.]|uniref:hypothetical protein n=1 Tax=Bradyrhizobium sp. TaxID=376 RepID=UPI001DF9D7A4|nr:hypothetical protein [Bradyrhizobium sp.]MBV9559864.1 hypothetical protein [Bradyrhizobium sp.]